MKVAVFVGIEIALAFGVPARGMSEQAVVGTLKVVTGAAFVHRDGQSLTAQVGDRVLQTDRLQTGADGALGVVLRDDSRLSLGPNSEVRIEQFAFAPAEGKLALVIKIVRGIAAYVSGKIAELSTESVEVETPMAVVGIRGTRFAVKVAEQ